MKKLVFGDVIVKTKKCECDFCGENKMCFLSPKGMDVPRQTVRWILKEGLTPSHFYERVGGGIISSGEYKYVVPADGYLEPEYVGVYGCPSVAHYLAICKDCAKQMR